MKILFVCLGNICRSPMAQGILEHKIKERGLTNWSTDSAGTSGWHDGEDPDPRTIKVLENKGIDLHHKSRRLRVEDFKDFDKIFVMDNKNLLSIESLVLSDEIMQKVELITNYDPRREPIVVDPYTDGIEGFEKVYTLLDRSIENFLNDFTE